MVSVCINWIVQIAANYISGQSAKNNFVKNPGTNRFWYVLEDYKIWSSVTVAIAYGRTGTSIAFWEIKFCIFHFNENSSDTHFMLKMRITTNKSGSHPHFHRPHNFKLYFKFFPLVRPLESGLRNCWKGEMAEWDGCNSKCNCKNGWINASYRAAFDIGYWFLVKLCIWLAYRW